MISTMTARSFFSQQADTLAGMAAKAVIAMVFLLAFVAGANAQDIPESHLDAARAAVVATKSSKRFDNILPALAERVKARLIANQPDQEDKITQVVNEAAIELAPRRGDLETEIATIYAKSFSEEELVQVKDFFTSTAGAKFLDLSPVLLRELDRVSQIWAAGMDRDLTTKVSEMLRASGDQEAPKTEGEAKEGSQ